MNKVPLFDDDTLSPHPYFLLLFCFPPRTTLHMPCVCVFVNTAQASTKLQFQLNRRMKKEAPLESRKENGDNKEPSFLFWFVVVFKHSSSALISGPPRLQTLANTTRLLRYKQKGSRSRVFAFSFSLLIPRECKYNVQQRHGTKRWRAAEQERRS